MSDKSSPSPTTHLLKDTKEENNNVLKVLEVEIDEDKPSFNQSLQYFLSLDLKQARVS